MTAIAEAYAAAAALELGEIGSFVRSEADEPATPTQSDDSEKAEPTYTGYIFRRAEGNMCEEGESGIVKIDYYPGIRETAESELRQEKWLSDAVYEDAMYAYKGQIG